MGVEKHKRPIMTPDIRDSSPGSSPVSLEARIAAIEATLATLSPVIDGALLPAPTTVKRGGVKETGTPSGKFLRDDDSWQSVSAAASRIDSVPADIGLVHDITFGNGSSKVNGLVSYTNAGGTEATGGDADRVCNKYTQDFNTGVTGPQVSTALVKAAMSPVFYADFKIAGSQHMYLQVGFCGGLSGQGNSGPQAMLTWLSGTDTNFIFRTTNGSANQVTNTGVAKDNAWHRVRIYSPDAGVTWLCYLDGVLVATHSTTVPVTSTIQYAVVGYQCHSAASSGNDMRTSRMVVWCGGRV